MKKIDEIYKAVEQMTIEKPKGVSAKEVAEFMNLGRANVSRYLNQLVKEGQLAKDNSRPVLFRSIEITLDDEHLTFDIVEEFSPSLRAAIQQAKAAILYPPNGLHTMLTGETGVGKSLFAELMYKFAKNSDVVQSNAPFIHFNCADYSENPQLLISQIFGVKKGAYTGANESKDGLLKKADQGFLFLDEVHRLSPQGQEMLFTYIDKGFFRVLGETNAKETVNVRLILATTENLDSYLLDTFQRRIPMIIHLLPLRKRTMKERFQLIKRFIKSEAIQVKKDIYMEENSLKSLLLYECKNNIGQLKSDIKLSCARGFLKYKSNNQNYIFISQNELPYHVKKGLMHLKEKRKEIERLLKDSEEVFQFKSQDHKGSTSDVSEEFYDEIEKKLETLKASGLSNQEINKIVNLDIDSYFKKYIDDLSVNIEENEIASIVSQEVLELTKELLEYAESKLNRKYNERIYFGLALHLSSTVSRLKKGDSVYYPELNKVRTSYQKEFMLSMTLANRIDEVFDIKVPLDEVGYLTMFIAMDQNENVMEELSKVNVVVLMHGESTATSMVNVVKDLVKAKSIIGLNMPLDLEAQRFYEKVKERINALDCEKGVLFLVDMGSLVNFGKILEEELSIQTKTIDDVSTPTALAAARKADMGQSLEEIYQSISKNRMINYDHKKDNDKEKIIISACFTGKGASDKIKQYLQENLRIDIPIKTLDLIDQTEFHKKLQKIKEKYEIKAIISTVHLEINEVPFFEAIDIFTGSGLEALKKLLEVNKSEVLPERLADHLMIEDVEGLINDIETFIYSVENQMHFKILSDVRTGIIMHITFLIDQLVQGKTVNRENHEIHEFRSSNSNQIFQLSELINTLEESYQVIISDDEKAYIYKMFKKNSL
jgi:transcriptional regulatory protein LevR/transcriptional regulator with AAA-type ATPase domain